MDDLDLGDGVVVLPLKKWRDMQRTLRYYEENCRRYGEIVYALDAAIAAEAGDHERLSSARMLSKLAKGRQWFTDRKMRCPAAPDGLYGDDWKYVTIDPIRGVVVLKDIQETSF